MIMRATATAALFMTKLLSPFSMMTTVVALAIIYYQAGNGDGGPLWKEIAVGCLTIIATLASLGYHSFVTRVERVERHNVNMRKAVAAILVSMQRLHGDYPDLMPDFRVEDLFEEESKD